MWAKAGGSAALKAAVGAAGAAAGLIYQGAAFVASKFAGAAIALWAMVGSPGKGVIAAAGAAGAKAGAAYAGATAGGGMLGAAALALRAAAPLAIPVVIAVAAKPILDDIIEQQDISQKSKDMITGKAFGGPDSKPGDEGVFRFPWEQGGFFHQDGADLAETMATDLSEGFRGSNAMATLPKVIGAELTSAVGDGWQEVSRATNAMATLPLADNIKDDFAAARKAVMQGFGSVKAALANPPQLISRKDRLSNMEGRMKKIMRNLRKAVDAEDPANIGYWQKAAIKQQGQMDRMRGKTVASVSDIRATFDKMGVKVEGTWLGVERSARRSSKKARRSARAEFRALVGDVKGFDLKSAGTALIGSWIAGIEAARTAVATAAASLTDYFGKFFHGSAVPKQGPLKGFDRMGGDMIDAWIGTVRGRRGRVQAAGREMAGAFQPRIGAPGLAAVGAVGRSGDAGGGTTVVNVGVLVADEAGLDELDRRMGRRRRRTSRNRGLYNDPN